MPVLARTLLATLLALCLCAQALAAPQGERRVALVIGNGAYREGPLKNPANDARDMAAALRTLGFEVTLRENATRRAMNEAIDGFWQSLKRGGTGLFFFAGHGLQVAGENYLVPVDAVIRVERDVQEECVSAGKVLGRMENAGNSMNIVILDACRNNPFARSFRSGDRGLAKMDAPTGSLIAFATAPGDVAADGEGKNGLYTSHLLRNLRSPGLKVEDVLKLTRIGVAADSAKAGKKQTPWESSSLMGDFYFAGGQGQAAAWQAASLPAPQATAAAPKQAPAAPSGPRTIRTWTEPATGMEFVWIEPGCFLMGKAADPGENINNKQHKVCLSGHWMGRRLVTNKQFRMLFSKHVAKVDAKKDGPDTPVNADSAPAAGGETYWENAKKFANWMSSKGSGQYRLPTEAEWEHAARAGSTLDIVPASTLPNALGLYDLPGPVWQWCEDNWAEDAYSRHARQDPVNSSGVQYFYATRGATSDVTHRFAAPMTTWVHPMGGFRLVRLAPPPEGQSAELPPRAWLGLEIRDADAPAAKAAGLMNPGGALVVRVVPGSPAEAAGVQAGDIVLMLEGAALDTANALRLKAAGSDPGTALRLGFWRGGRMHEVTARLAAPPAQTSPQANQQAASAAFQEFFADFSGQPAKAQRFRGDLEGTRWTMRGSIPDTPTVLEFLPGGVLRYVEVGNLIEKGATWRQSGDTVSLVFNGYAEYTGKISGSGMSGQAKNPLAKWTWTAKLAQ